ncbi:hypothetical protein [Flavimaricola marinus]|uniref:Ceramidase n=1 Tax=Flavimaricola marinus TaxID=1819565 RepID=A0A238LG77_9RHOB|nr:hypothetical protein [Flavimaricola marinus]SMY08573.1 hypothetical protein LOM8899_02727 [Flavimaricola marinus]
MDWTAQVDAYCERMGPEFWAEPLNALTNLGYLIVGLWTWRRMVHVPLGPALSLILVAISVGSFLFHTLATEWAGLADTAPIGVFILLYLFALNRYVVGWPLWAALLGTAAYVPYAALMLPWLDRLPFVQISNFYWTVPIALVVYAAALRRLPLAKGLLAGAVILCVSISLRSVDLLWCESWPLGTHFLWHTINAGMFVVVLETYRRHCLAAGPAGR